MFKISGDCEFEMYTKLNVIADKLFYIAWPKLVLEQQKNNSQNTSLAQMTN